VALVVAVPILPPLSGSNLNTERRLAAHFDVCGL
jgi:hypothetical protein